MEEFRSFKFFFLILQLVAYVESRKCFDVKETPLVNTKSGWLQGKFVQNQGANYYSFKGIPYAEPPVGKLRFQAPEPVKKWKGVRDALEHGSYCANRWGFFGVTSLKGGNEDCLFLNVYSPDLSGKRPVMFWIHGGAFMSGNGDTTFYGPEHLIKKDVVVVSINHRYSAFGFLSTGDENAPGNQGLKDIRLALKWVQKNIKKFGGDPDQVTIFGHSAGSVAVDHMMISDSTKGLFHSAIMESGSSLMTCLFQDNPRPEAENLGRKLNLTFSDTKELIEKLSEVDFQRIVDVESNLFTQGDPWGLRTFEFQPSVEPQGTKNAFLTEKPIQRMLDGNFQRVPIMMGSPSFEGMFIALYFYGVPTALDHFNANPQFIVPFTFNIKDDEVAKMEEATKEVQKIYFNGNTQGTLTEWLSVYSDGIFSFSNYETGRFHADDGAYPVFYYKFSFDGSLNFFKKNLSLGNFEGASHGDELFYLFEPGLEGFTPDVNSSLVREQMTTLWTNFAKYGNPTPEQNALITEIWKPFTSEDESYYEIGADMTLSNKNYPARMKQLADLQIKYTGHY